MGVGAFDTDEMMAKVEEYYGQIPAQSVPNLFIRPEPPQQGERRVSVERPGKTAFYEICHRIPSATHDDWAKLEILDNVFTGSSGASDNKTSWLYRALVKSEIAASVGGGINPTIDPYLYSIVVTLRDNRTPQEAEAVVLSEIERLQTKGITEAELKKAKKQAKAAFAYSTESVTEQAYWLARSFILGEDDWFEKYVDRLMAVTLDDVKDVANRYLTSKNRVVGILVPTEPEVEAV